MARNGIPTPIGHWPYKLAPFASGVSAALEVWYRHSLEYPAKEGEGSDRVSVFSLILPAWEPLVWGDTGGPTGI